MSEHEHCNGGCCCHDDDDCSCGCHDDGCSCGCSCGCGHDHEHEKSGKAAWIRLGAAFLLLIGAVLTSAFGTPEYISIPLYILAYLVAGYEVLIGAVRGIVKGHFFGENFLMSIASIGALVIGEYAEGCAVMLLFEFGERLQAIAVAKSRNSIRQILEMRPDSITLVKDGKETAVKPHDAHIGDIFIVKAGDKVALDGEIIDGEGDFDMSSLTGESLPVSKAAGDTLLAGSISIDGTFRVRATEEYENSTVSKLLDLIEHAKSKKSRTESFISRFARIYTPIVCALAAAVAFVPPLLGFGDLGTWVYRGLCALAASCPCALVISIPLGFFGGLGAASREGILIKGSNYLEALSKANYAAFDKTGTLTSGAFSYIGEENVRDGEKLHFAVAVCEKYSTHPIAKAATEKFGSLAQDVQIEETHTLRGMGVCAEVNGHIYRCGNASLMEEYGIDYEKATLTGSVVYAAIDNEFLGSMTFADTVKEDSKSALGMLKALGITDTAMLSGDKREIAERVGAALGISNVHAELLPADKATAIEEVKSRGKRAIYVGDGINDAPVLALADVGVAMGGIGSAAALEAADAVIMGESLEKLPAAIRIARKTMRIVRQNIVFSLTVKIGIILFAALGFANLWVAVFGDVGVCLIAVLNALRVLRRK